MASIPHNLEQHLKALYNFLYGKDFKPVDKPIHEVETILQEYYQLLGNMGQENPYQGRWKEDLSLTVVPFLKKIANKIEMSYESFPSDEHIVASKITVSRPKIDGRLWYALDNLIYYAHTFDREDYIITKLTIKDLSKLSYSAIVEYFYKLKDWEIHDTLYWTPVWSNRRELVTKSAEIFCRTMLGMRDCKNKEMDNDDFVNNSSNSKKEKKDFIKREVIADGDYMVLGKIIDEFGTIEYLIILIEVLEKNFPYIDGEHSQKLTREQATDFCTYYPTAERLKLLEQF